MDKMYCYLWSEKGNKNESKFGERWVLAGQDPMKECRKRIRESMGVRKDLFDNGEVIIHKIWDVSELAQKVGRYYKQSRMDDYLREFIGHRKGSTGEIHLLSGDDMMVRVNKLLHKQGQPLPVAGLSTKQYQVAEEVLTAIQGGSRCVLAELCARFGKTLWAGAVFLESDAQICIVASYVKTVFTSFEQDMTSFEQFSDIVHIDTAKEDYQDQINDALAQGKRVVVYLSMAPGQKRQERIDYLFGLKQKKMLVVDEADFGVHKKGQSQVLVDAIDETVYTIIMTGTNADKAASIFPVDHFVSVTYPELLIQKKATKDAEEL